MIQRKGVLQNRIGLLLAMLLLTAAVLSGCSGSGIKERRAAAETALKNKDYQTAADEYTQLIASGGQLEEAYRGLGVARMGLGEYEEAKEALLQSLANGGILPKESSYDTNYYLAACCYKLGEVDEAIAIYDAILNLRDKDIDAYELRGTAKLQKKDEAGARADFDKAFSLASGSFDRILSYYEILSEYGMEELGRGYLEKTLADNDKALTDYEKGRLYYYLGDYAQSKTFLEQARAANGDYRTCSALGQTYEALGDYNYAISVYETYLDTDKSHVEIYNRLGLCHMKMENYADALRAFEQGKATGGTEAMQDISYNEIVAHEYLGEWKQAALLMETYLQNYPNDETAQREYVFLKTR
ncbi:MAG: tetratricopeptide repeat protein [Lachnospiraceae bacterium]|nr:tetratricopeptide repeat protein [Lachnospiraceae bacterium]